MRTKVIMSQHYVIMSSDNVTDDGEFVFLFDLNISKNSVMKYWKYHSFDLTFYGYDDAAAQFQLMKGEIPRLRDVLGLST